MKRVVGASPSIRTILAVGMSRVVQELKLRTGEVRFLELRRLDDVKEETAVSVRRDLPVELQVEACVLLVGDEVDRGRNAGERVVLYGLPFREALSVISVPARCCLAVEQELPAVGLFFVGERVRLVGRLKGADSCHRRHDHEEYRSFHPSSPKNGRKW